MILRDEVVHRLLLAKSILLPARNEAVGQPNAHAVARHVLSAHDAADLVFAAVADQKKLLPAKSRSPTMMGTLNLLGKSANLYAGYFQQLNEARDSLKHVGNLPNTQQWANVADDTFKRLSGLCLATLSVSLEDIDEIELVANGEVKGHLYLARRHWNSQDLRRALEEIGVALYIIFNQHPNLGEMEVGKGNAEDALKLTAYSIPASNFLALQEFLPEVSKFGDNPVRIAWKQNRFGHPGNWQKEVVDFCLKTCVTVAISVQAAPVVPYPLDFKHLYRYKVTAKEDQTEVWEDLAKDHLSEVGADFSRPFRTHKRYLNKGESVMVSALTDPLVSDDLSLGGEEIQRVQIHQELSESILGSMLGKPGRAEFVNLAQVDIICVPHTGELMEEQFPNLQEIAWEPPPDQFLPLVEDAPIVGNPFGQNDK